jgi:hypothetical protein
MSSKRFLSLTTPRLALNYTRHQHFLSSSSASASTHKQSCLRSLSMWTQRCLLHACWLHLIHKHSCSRTFARSDICIRLIMPSTHSLHSNICQLLHDSITHRPLFMHSHDYRWPISLITTDAVIDSLINSHTLVAPTSSVPCHSSTLHWCCAMKNTMP